MILNKTPPPKKKTQHETNASAGSSPACALAGGQILTCMPAGDSKMNPTGKKSLLSTAIFYIFKQNILFRQHHDSQQDPPKNKRLSTKQMLRRLSPARALTDGQILTCMPAGDIKNKLHWVKKPSFFFQCGRAITRKQDIKHHNHTK